jgi:deoxyhypusine synthase
MGSTGTGTAVPSSVAAAVLTPSHEMPKGSQKVVELDFNAYSGQSITVEDLISGMNHMGFQASSIGEAVRIINDMVCTEYHNSCHHITPQSENPNGTAKATNEAVESVARSRDW